MKIHTRARKHTAMPLQTNPNFPRSNLPRGNSYPLIRFASTQPTARRYDEMRPVRESEVRIANATGEPIMKSERAQVMA